MMATKMVNQMMNKKKMKRTEQVVLNSEANIA